MCLNTHSYEETSKTANRVEVAQYLATTTYQCGSAGVVSTCMLSYQVFSVTVG